MRGTERERIYVCVRKREQERWRERKESGREEEKKAEKRERKREREGMTMKGEARGWHDFQNK